MRVGWLWVLVMIVVATTAGAAFADDPSIARPTAKAALAHLEEGNKLYKVRDFAKAAEEYKAGALVEPAPIFDYNLGQCYRQAGDYKAAIWHYKQFLQVYTTPGPRLDSVQKFIAQMQAELDQQARKEEPTEPAPSAGSGGATTPPQPVVVAPVQQAAPEGPTERWYQDWFGWGLAGTGVVGVAVGTGLLLDASSINDEANHTSNQQQQTALHQKADTRSLLGTVIGIGGIGLLATGVIKLAVHPHASPSRASALDVGVSPNGVFVFGRF